MAWRLFGAKPLPEQMLAYCQLASLEKISKKFELEFYHFHWWKYIWRTCLPKCWPFCPGGDESMPSSSNPGNKVYGAYMGPTGPRWVPCWPHEFCYLGSHYVVQSWPNSMLFFDIIRPQCVYSTHWGRDKMAAIFSTTFSNVFSLMKMYEFWLRFQWSLFPGVQLTIFQYWFRQWLGADQVTSHYLNQWWLDYQRFYASLNILMHVCVNWPQWVNQEFIYQEYEIWEIWK